MIKGSWVALVTPMHPDGGVDYSALSDLIDWHLNSSTSALAILGTTAESPCITSEERSNIIQSTVQQVDGRLPVWVGTGANATQQAVAFSKEAQLLGADGVFVVSPYYNKPTQEGLYQHFMAIVDVISIPLMLYNHPGRTGVDLLPETVARLAEHPRIAGIKDATGGTERLRAMQNLNGDFAYYSGDDGTALDFILAGGDGVISVAANVVPDQFGSLCEFALQGDAAKARDLNAQLAPLYRALGLETNPIPVKWALNALGRISSGIRLPLTPLTASHHATMLSALTDAGLAVKNSSEVV